jgi:hypothetical protein
MAHEHLVRNWIASLTATLALLLVLEEQVTKFLAGVPFIATTLQNWISSTSAISKEVETARQTAREAAASARALAEVYPSSAVDRVLKNVMSLKFVDNNGLPSVQRSDLRYWGPLNVSGHFQGTGHLESSQYVCDCQFNDGKMTGLGRVTFASGYRWEGELRDSLPNGFGCYFSPSGASTCGAFDNGRYFGVCKALLDGQTELLGQSRKYAVLIFTSVETENAQEGMRYEGEIRGNDRNGYGVAYFANGTRYEGQWIDRWQQGAGAQIDAHGLIEKAGIWEKGMLKTPQ